MSNNPIRKTITVSIAALVNAEKKILLGKRPQHDYMGNFWEFPGGKVRMNETPVSCIIRELKEELKIKVKEKDLFPLSFFTHDYANLSVAIFLFGCTKWEQEIVELYHQELMWVNGQHISQFSMLEANYQMLPFINSYVQSLCSK